VFERRARQVLCEDDVFRPGRDRLPGSQPHAQGEQQRDGVARHRAQPSPRPEAQQQVPCPARLRDVDEDRTDQEAAEDEEELNAEEAAPYHRSGRLPQAPRPGVFHTAVADQHHDDRDRPDEIEAKRSLRQGLLRCATREPNRGSVLVINER
jgi:hypothetical protein